MVKKKNIIGICGSASKDSNNLFILKEISKLLGPNINLEIIDGLAELPHFQTELTNENTPDEITQFRNKIENADGIVICTPEYIFSIPSGLKNIIEWSVSTTIFSGKPTGLITASASGIKGHEELKLIMETLQVIVKDETTLLIQGVKGKINNQRAITHESTRNDLAEFSIAFDHLIKTYSNDPK